MFKEQISEVVRLLQTSARPIFIWGAGIRGSATQALALARSLGVPVACTWGALDLVNHNDPLMCGGFGTHGTRAANFAIANSDLVISIGSRLDTKATGDPRTFARGARVVMVDIDSAEIAKFEKLSRHIDIGICADAGEVIDALLATNIHMRQDIFTWLGIIRGWRKRYDTPVVTWPGINPYQLVKDIGKHTTKEDILCSDTGTALGYLMQAFPFKGERFLHAFNMTPMGYGLPAAIGAAFATAKRLVLITGDGSLMMSLSELATLSRHALNIKIILLNNHQHAMCVQTENQWFGGRNAGTTPESGLGFPQDWETVVKGFGIRVVPSTAMGQLFDGDGPAFCQVEIHKDAKLIPQARFGYPIEDQEPMLDREEFKQQMIVETI